MIQSLFDDSLAVTTGWLLGISVKLCYQWCRNTVNTDLSQ